MTLTPNYITPIYTNPDLDPDLFSDTNLFF